MNGAVNAVAPNPVRNVDFTRELGGGRSIGRRFLPVPKFALQVMFGEMGEIVYASQRVMAGRRAPCWV